MTRKIEIPDIDNLAERYIAGESIKELAREIGVAYKVLWQRFKRMGLDTSRSVFVMAAAYIERYIDGETEQALASELGIDRQTFRKHLLKANITPRGISETMYARWAQASESERAAMMKPAHEATKGRTRSLNERIKAAQTRQERTTHASPVEYMFADALRILGWDIIQQRAIGPYNVDIAIDFPPIAIEIFGGHWHAHGHHMTTHTKRCKHILDAGWNMLFIWVDGLRYPLRYGATKYVVAFNKALRSSPAITRQYWVILGNGELAPVEKSYLNTPSFIKRLGGEQDFAWHNNLVTG